MAKRKGLRAPKHHSPTSASKEQHTAFTAAQLLHPSPAASKRRVAKAHAKRRFDEVLPASRPTLADRFAALPTELRAHIFSFLLVQPVKWALEHELPCPLYSNPDLFITFQHDPCARCGGHCYPSAWRPLAVAWQELPLSPWRSKYAPPVTNPFLCSNCWDADFRQSVTGLEFPNLRELMPCLCARRNELDILLVCRRWYEEASRVLWSRNTFAFEDSRTFTKFARNCPRPDLVTKVSILDADRSLRAHVHIEFEWPDWAYDRKRQALITALRSFPALTHLELDAVLLHDVRDVRTMLRLGLRTVRSVRFIHHADAKKTTDVSAGVLAKGHYIYPSLASALLLRGGLAEEVARAIKGEHRAWTKHHELPKRAIGPKTAPKRPKPRVSLLQRALEQHLVIEESLQPDTVPENGIVNCDDTATWAKLWWKVDGRLHWSQSYLTVGADRYESAGWVEKIWEEKLREWREAFPFAELEL